MNEEIEEYYEELYRLYIDENQPLERRYRQLRESLERVVREKIQGNSLQTTDLAARINYVATQYGLDLKEQNQLHTFRLTSNDILNHRKSPVKEEFLRDLRAVAYAYQGKKKRWNTSAASVYALIMPMIPICMYIL